jgi:hypothetical protein
VTSDTRREPIRQIGWGLANRAQNGDNDWLAMPSDESELLAQQVSGRNRKFAELEKRVAESEKVNARLEQAALITARALQEVSGHWDAVYEAMRREEAASVGPEQDQSDEVRDEFDVTNPS